MHLPPALSSRFLVLSVTPPCALQSQPPQHHNPTEGQCTMWGVQIALADLGDLEGLCVAR